MEEDGKLAEERLLDLLVRRVVAHDDQFRVFQPALSALVAGKDVPRLIDLADALDSAEDVELLRLRLRLEQRLLGLARRAHALSQEGREWSGTMRQEFKGLELPEPVRAGRALDLLETAARRLERGAEAAYANLVATMELEEIPWAYLPWRALCIDAGMSGLELPEKEEEPLADPDAMTRAERRRTAICYALARGTAGGTPKEVIANYGEQRARRFEELDRRGRTLAARYPEQLARIIADIHPAATEAMRENLRPQPEPEPVPKPVEVVAPPPPPPKRVPKPPSIWRKHLQPFLLENWYVAVGALMVVVGSSLVAFFTWERHWAVRYTVLPALLGAFTATLAWLGSWLERQDATLTGTGAVLRGAAIALLPINFMTVALLAGDPEIGNTQLVVPLVAALYLGLFGFGLHRWCAGVHPALGSLLGGTLIALCALVVLRPIAATLAVDETTVRTILGAGFYLGFAGLAAAVLAFTGRVLDESLAREKRVPWFFGAILVLTFVQVFAWVHASIGHLPRVHTYAPMVILAGALLLHTERRVLALSGKSDRLVAESFLGYALILLGLLMAQPEPYVRILGFALAGAAWVRQATPRDNPLHAWIGLTLIALAGASVSLLPGFPGEWRAWLGVGLAVGFGAFSRGRDTILARTARDLQVALLVLSSVVAMLAQWHYKSEPLWTAALLVVSSGMLMIRAHREGRERWVLTAAVQLALALPYLGCVDLAGRTWNGNTMVFGLGALSLGWIALDFIRPTKLTRAARSTVLWFYGGLAVAAMTLRVFLEHGTLHPVLDHIGPLLSAIALVFATYWSRSLIPAAMAAAILVILFPELRSHYREAFDQLGWGSGLGSAISSALLVCICFGIRRMPMLQKLGPGDRFLGRAPFPLRRHDWTLFTLPIVASVVFLLVKTGTVLLVLNYEAGMTTKAALAQVVCGATWVGLATYGRRYDAARQAVRLGFLQLFVGLVLWPYHEFIWSRPLLIHGVVVQAFALAVRRFGADWAQPLLAAPASALVRRAALVVAPLCVIGLLPREVANTTHVLVAFCGAVLVVAGVTRRRRRYGALVYPLILVEVLYWTKGDVGPLLRTTPWHVVVTAASVALGVQMLAIGMPNKLLRPVMRPLHGWSIASAALGVMYATTAVVLHAPHETAGLVVITAAAFAVAHVHASGLFFVLGTVPVYLIATDVLLMPWRLGLYALLLAASGRYATRLLVGRDPVPFDRIAPEQWIAGASVLLAIAAAGLQLVVPEWREAQAQLAASYLAAGAWFLSGRLVRMRESGYCVAALFTLGNILSIRVLAGEWLSEFGITPIQKIAMGFAVTLVCALGLRRRVRATDIVDRSAAVLATILLVLLATQYVAQPDLAEMTVTRLLVSGALAYVAAFSFRTMARRPHAPVAVPVRFAESAYHLGLTIALWCVALVIPWFRQPAAALVALSVPFFFFVLRADLLRGSDRQTERSYVESASVLGYLLLALYLLRSIFQLILFPGTDVATDHYHHNSLLVMAVGLGLLRLHIHGHGYWRAFYGGVALIVGSYFAITAFPGLSIFEHPVAAGWALIAVAHFWTLASQQRSPLRAGIQQMAGIDDEEWITMRRGWGVLLLLAAQAPPLLAAIEWDTYAIAPLLAGSASVVVYHGILRRLPVYFVLAATEIVLALHLDLLVPSYLPWRSVIWILLAGWGAMLLFRLPLRLVQATANLLAVLVFGHVLLHGPSSGVGLAGFAIGVLLLLATPRASARWTGDPADAWTPVLLLAPAWLAYFAALRGYDYVDAWPLLAAVAAFFATGAAAAWIRVQEIPFTDPAQPRLASRLFDLARSRGDRIGAIALYISFAVAAGVFVLHYERPFETRELILLCLLFAGCATGFHFDGQERRAMLPYYLLQVSVLALFATIRRQLMLTTDFWSYEYDVWAACTTTVALAGAKEVWDLRPRAVGVPVTTSLFALPVVAMIWTVVHGLGVNVALLVLGVHSLTYSFLGRDDRESPYNLVAVAGFVAFVVLTFWSKLELKSAQAYVVPVGIGILVLTQLFRARLAPAVRNQIRFVAVASMIGTAAYEALLDPRYPVGFHVSLLLLGIAGMTLGGFLRVRIYLLTGCAGVLTALGSIVYRGLAGLEKAARMSAVGVLVLLLGAGLVAGAIYYKTHRERVNATVDEWRRRLGEWD